MTEPEIVDTPVYRLQRGHRPLLVSIPHCGTALPEALRPTYTDEALRLSDTDWHLERLYAFAAGLGASVLQAKVSRYVIDLNRPSTGESLYPGQATTGLCPTETFRGQPLYRPGQAPDADETARRVQAYWAPYHQALRDELQRLRQRHAQVLLWEGHSIASELPRLFEGRLPDLNFGTHSGAACDAALLQAVLAALPPTAGLTHVVNGRFKGGHITRAYGQPAQGVHAIQLEKCQCLYMDEESPYGWREDRAARLQPVLQAMLKTALRHLG